MKLENQDALTLAELARMLGNGVTPANLRGRIRRGSLAAFLNAQGEWLVNRREARKIMEEVEPCQSCPDLAASFVIVKYHQHHRVEFTLCPDCAQKAQSAYSRQGGVLEVVVYPLHGEGWMKS